ncbi:MAG: M13 family metallopeptidase, partial [Methanospirillum sp.]|uniref:M13 family metallopeptidase n=1 Tax=Methanospirillum sp. TaxID=45200 RepID=UPI002371ECA6
MQEFKRIISVLGGIFILLMLIGPVTALTPDDMDLSVKPGDDLFSYANGNWMERNPVPADLSFYSSVSEVQQSVDDRVRTIIEDAAANPGEDGYEKALIGTFYNTALDQDLADRVGMEPLRPELNRIAAAQTREDIRNLTIYLMNFGISPFFSFYADEDPGNSSMLVATIEQSGTSLPDREYYFRDDTESERVRDEFKGHVSRMFVLNNESPEQADIDAATVLRIETRLANASAPSHGYGKPDRRYFPCPVRRLNEVTDGIDWDGLLTAVNRTDLSIIDMYQPLYVREVGNVLKEEPVADLKKFLTFKVLQFAAPYSSQAFEQENFNFNNRVLSGQEEMEPRWKRVIGIMDAVMGGVVGELYVQKYFTPEEKAHVKEIVENLKSTLKVRLSNLTWMDPETRDNATEKLDSMGIQIGYPDQSGDYSNLEVSNRSYLDNILNITCYYYRASLQIADTPSNPDTWYLSPHSVNAYYDTTRNKIVLPAGVLQPPFYDPAVDDAEHYGAIGAIIGHELIHGFDSPLRKFVKDGNETLLWNDNDTVRFKEVTTPLVAQYDQMEALPGLYLNGTRTLAENAADLGGMIIAWNAW